MAKRPNNQKPLIKGQTNNMAKRPNNDPQFNTLKTNSNFCKTSFLVSDNVQLGFC